ncbi:MAG: hypothetical protein JWO07_449 [Candidatus Saccharibacteria bacterium]|nr:hypothetical protein [Candidatus Saccharibacteria bacterium]
MTEGPVGQAICDFVEDPSTVFLANDRLTPLTDGVWAVIVRETEDPRLYINVQVEGCDDMRGPFQLSFDRWTPIVLNIQAIARFDGSIQVRR